MSQGNLTVRSSVEDLRDVKNYIITFLDEEITKRMSEQADGSDKNTFIAKEKEEEEKGIAISLDKLPPVFWVRSFFEDDQYLVTGIHGNEISYEQYTIDLSDENDLYNYVWSEDRKTWNSFFVNTHEDSHE